jgi:ribose 1,5-bisphosphokinase
MNGDRHCGTMIVVVGPSGAGKDTLIDFARERLAADPGIVFVRRTITRASTAGSEDHEAVSDAAFEARARAGEFAVHWQAHGLHYGIPVATRALLASGKTLVANGSRAALQRFAAAYAHIQIVAITADPDVIAARLAARGREDSEGIAQRLSRSVPAWSLADDHITIDNSGTLDDAGARFVACIRKTAGAASLAHDG